MKHLRQFGLVAAFCLRSAAPAAANAPSMTLPPHVSTPDEQCGQMRLENTSGTLAATVGTHGIELFNGARNCTAPRFSLRTVGFGRGNAAALSSPDNTFGDHEYIQRRFGSLIEWVHSDSAGFQHGFFLQSPPTAMSEADASGEAGQYQPVVLDLSFDPTYSVLLAQGGTDAYFVSSDSATCISYAGLKAWDATGKELRAELALNDSHLRIQVDDTEAVYPLAIDPWIIVQEARLKPAVETILNHDNFGSAVSLSGESVAIGAPFDYYQGGTAQTGSAFVFVRQDGAWVQQAWLIGRDSRSADGFGIDVAIEGDTLVVGAIGHDYNGLTTSGAVYVFERVGQVWKQSTKITPGDPVQFGNFGESVALSGSTLAVGAFGTSPGSIYVFERTGATWAQWVQQAKLTSPFAELGREVQIQGDRLAGGDMNGDGSVFIFDRVGGVWGPGMRISASNPMSNAGFGAAISLDGDHMGVGAPLAGFAYVFDNIGGLWTESALLSVSEAPAARFGDSVSLIGPTLVVGATLAPAPTASGQQTDGGAAYVFEFNGAWSQTHKIVSGDAHFFDQFGAAMASNGSLIAAGTPGFAGSQGTAYVYRIGWPTFCFGDGSLQTACPCAAPDVVPSPSGSPRSGCANSFDLGGARLLARGLSKPDTVSFEAYIGANYNGFALLVKGDASNALGIANGDGVRCVDGALIRFGGHNAGTNGDSPGLWSYPNAAQTTSVSSLTGQTVGQSAFYQLLYRNAAPGFCSPATTNWTNGVRIDW